MAWACAEWARLDEAGSWACSDKSPSTECLSPDSARKRCRAVREPRAIRSANLRSACFLSDRPEPKINACAAVLFVDSVPTIAIDR